MNELQLERWKQMSMGLARSYTNLTPARKQKLLAEVGECIDWVICNGLETVDDWDRSIYKDGKLVELCAGTRVSDWLWDSRYEFERGGEVVCGRFGHMLCSCVRAGFDMAVSPSGGVVGFTVGDLRDIFDGTIPDWIADQFAENKPALLSAGREEGLWL